MVSMKEQTSTGSTDMASTQYRYGEHDAQEVCIHSQSVHTDMVSMKEQKYTGSTDMVSMKEHAVQIL